MVKKTLFLGPTNPIYNKSSATITEVENYLRPIVDNICTELGLVILSEITNGKQKRYVLTLPELDYPLLCVMNASSDTYYYRDFHICLPQSSETGEEYDYKFSQNETLYNCYCNLGYVSYRPMMYYIKLNDGTIAFDFTSSNIMTPDKNVKFIISKTRINNKDLMMSSIVYQNSISLQALLSENKAYTTNKLPDNFIISPSDTGANILTPKYTDFVCKMPLYHTDDIKINNRITFYSNYLRKKPKTFVELLNEDYMILNNNSSSSYYYPTWLLNIEE